MGQISILICKAEVLGKAATPIPRLLTSAAAGLDLIYGAVNIHEWTRVPWWAVAAEWGRLC